jgi:hypothetical protein
LAFAWAGAIPGLPLPIWTACEPEPQASVPDTGTEVLLRCIVSIGLAALAACIAMPPLALAAEAPHWPGRLALELEQPADPSAGATVSAPAGLADWLQARGGVLDFHFPSARREAELWKQQRLGAWLWITVADTVDIPAACRQLTVLAGVRSASPDWVTWISQPNDPLYPLQWALHNTGQALSTEGLPVGLPGADMDAPAGWELLPDPGAPLVALLDTGIDINHLEFAGRLLPGFNFLTQLPGAIDDNGHGTAVAGLLGAEGDNGRGLAGVAWRAQILPLKVFNSIGQGSASALANALNYARQLGTRVANYSGGMSNDYGPASVQIAAGLSEGMWTVAAAGNSNAQGLDFPARDPLSLAVGAHSPCGDRKTPESCDGETWWGSNWGTELDLLAPGSRLTTTARGGGYRHDFNGSSAACAFVSGSLLLLRGAFPELTAAAAGALLFQSAQDIGPPGHDPDSGWGRLRLGAAVRRMVPPRITGLSCRVAFGRVILGWRALEGAEEYRVEWAPTPTGPWSPRALVAEPAWQSPPGEQRAGSRFYRVIGVLPIPEE